MSKEKFLHKAGVISTKVVYSPLFVVHTLLLDLISISYFIISVLVFNSPVIWFEFLLAGYFMLEYLILFFSSKNKRKYLLHPLSVSNAIIILGYLLAPLHNFGILRIIRILRVIHLYQLIPDIRLLTDKIGKYEKAIANSIHIVVLSFVISEIVFISQYAINSQIDSRLDALYETSVALSKFGFGFNYGTIGTEGKILAIVVGIISLSLSVQLVEVLRKTQRLRILDKKSRYMTRKEIEEELDEIHSEQLCTFCDIKNRESILSKNKRVDN